jgi:hypothetical protein
MHYVTRTSHRMEKYKFDVTCPGALFVESVLAPTCTYPGALSIDITCLGRSRLHYVNCRSHQMQKHRFSVTCPGARFVETALGPTEYEK